MILHYFLNEHYKFIVSQVNSLFAVKDLQTIVMYFPGYRKNFFQHPDVTIRLHLIRFFQLKFMDKEKQN